MTNRKTTKKALIFSALSLLLCFSMLVGTTFAWFTDSVTSTGNIIQSGTLIVALDWADGKADPANDATTWTDASAGAIFKSKLWEPGYTEARHLKISNEGTLALKYELAIIPNGTVSALADVIDVYYLDPAEQVADRTDLKNMTPVGTLRDLINGGICTGSLEADGEKIVTIVLKMQETAGNEYQDLSIGTDFAIQLLATQMTSESDSFDDQYDANAPYSFWDGKVPTEMPETLVVDGKTQTVHVKDAAAFAYLSTLSAKWAELYTDGNGRTYTNYANGAGANYYYSGQWTISLEADIDLGNYAIDPTVIVLGESTGASAFKGNNHTIRNINTTTGLFANNNRASYSYITLVNVKATNGALTGSSNTNITNVTVKNATLSGTDYVGGIVGYTYGEVNDCEVIDSSVVATGKEAGGLIGYVVTSGAEAHVAYNIVRNVSVYAGNRAAGLVGQVNVNVKVHNNTIDTVTVGAEDTSEYQANAVVSNAIVPENVYDNTVKNATVESSVAIVNDNAGLADAAKNNDTVIILAAGNYTLPTMNGKEGITIIGAEDGSTVIGGDSTSTGFGGNFGESTTIKNVTFAGTTNGVRSSYAQGGTTTFDNCTFAGDSTYGFHVDESKGATFIFNNCSFSGFNAFAGDLEKVVFNNCTFENNGNYGHTNIWSVGEFNNCTWGADTSVGPAQDSAKLYFDGVEESCYHEYIGTVKGLRNFRISVDDGEVSKTDKYFLVNDIDLDGNYWYPIKGAFNATFDGQGYSIKNMDLAHEYISSKSNVGFFTKLSTTAVIKNVTFDNANVAGEHYVGVIVGWEGNETTNATIDNCHVINSTVTCDTDANNDNGDKAGGICGYAVTLNITNCSVKDTTIKAYRDFGGILGCSNGSKVNVTGNTVENVTLIIDNDVNYKNYTTDAEHNANPVVGRENAGNVKDNEVK